MSDVVQQRVPFPGAWQKGEVMRTGSWTLGELWIDWTTHRYAVRVEERHCNATGMMHGGAIATFFDGQAFIVASAEMEEIHTPTISLSVDFLAPVRRGDWLVAEVELVKVTRTMIVTQALAMVNDRVVARANAIYSNTTRKEAP